MKTKSKRRYAPLIAAVAAVMLSGCGMISEETEERGMKALCVSADASVESLRAGGSGAKAVASLVHDLSEDDTVKEAAQAVRKGEGDEKAVETLTSWVGEAC